MTDSDILFVRHYGSVTRGPKGNVWVVKFRLNTFKLQRSFNVAMYESSDAAKQAAIEFRDSTSMSNGLSNIVRKKNYSQEIKEFVSGFLDGDGAICFSKRGDIIVMFTQSSRNGEPTILKYIQELYGGVIQLITPNTEKIKGRYSLKMTKTEAIPLLYDLKDHLILKREQAKVLFDYAVENGEELFQEETFDFLKKAKELAEYKKVIIPEERITDAYVSGLFDAEGCVTSAKDKPGKIAIRLAQISSPTLLTAIKDFYDRGSTSDKELKACGDNAVYIVDRIYKYSIVKRTQFDILLELANMRTGAPGARHSSETKEKMNELNRELARLKTL